MLTTVNTVMTPLMAVLTQRDASICLALLDMVGVTWSFLFTHYTGKGLDHPQIVSFSLCQLAVHRVALSIVRLEAS